MPEVLLSVRDLHPDDIDTIADYWLTADATFLQGMGVDTSKVPAREEWRTMLTQQVNTPLEQKQSYCLIWEVDGRAVGHSNINKIIFGREAYMHLHIWYPDIRKMGYGTQLVRKTLPYFFERYRLQTLYCEPYALNPAPNRTLAQVGFRPLKEYTTTPGWINFEQPVRLWAMTREAFEQSPANRPIES